MLCVEATYADDTAMSQALLLSLADHPGTKLFSSPLEVKFWTELPDRAFVVSFAALIPELDGTWLDGVGRWSNKASASCIRTQLQRVRIVQHKAAAMSHGLAASTAAEAEVYAQFGTHLVGHGCSLDFAV